MLLALLLLAASGFEIEYESYVPPRYEVFVFLGADCPLAKLYANRLSELADRYPQLHFQGVSANENDAAEKIAAFQKGLRFAFRKDPVLLSRLRPTRSPEAFLLVDGLLAYRGRIDDQYTPGTARAQPTRCDLEEAIQEVLAGVPVSVPETKATGCQIAVPNDPGRHPLQVTFDQVAAILHRRCAECHRPGEVAPFSLLTYEDTLGWKDMIKEVVSDNRMPPWHADPQHGKFANDRSLTAAEKAALLKWVAAGAPPGHNHPPAPKFQTGWSIRTDVVLAAQAFPVPAEGVLDYQEFVIDPGFTADTWVAAVEVRPGNTAIVHHVNVFLKPPGAPADVMYFNALEDLFFTVMVPGNTVTAWPAGIAKVVPAGWNIVLSVHYQPNGTPQTDQTRIALQVADSRSVRQQIATRAMLADNFVLPPNQVTTLTNTWTLEDDFTIHALMPHMHLRGRSMSVAADGEVLLHVPKYDFNWQHRYVLDSPKPLKKGTVIHCTAEYDNTADNPNNPNPNLAVHEGRQSSDEMFQLNVEITRTNENRLPRQQLPMSLISSLVAGTAFCFFRKR